MKKGAVFLAVAVFVLFTPESVFAQRGNPRGGTVEVRLASPMPRNSDWGRTLDRIAAEWARVTNNGVRLRILHDGVEGGETKVISSLATNNIQAALLTSFGLAEICPPVMTLSAPFLIASDDELELVLQNVLPIFEGQISRSNFVVLAWSKAGWVNVFSKDPVFVPDDLRKHRVGTNPESGNLNLAFRTMGFNLVETEIVDVGTKLANNMINAIYQTPAAVAPVGIHKTLGNMLDIPIAPFMGGIVMNRVTWNKLSADQQREIVRVTQQIATDFDATMPRTVANAVTMMQRDGLRINRVNADQEALWRAEVQRAMPTLLGGTFDRDIYQRINGILERSRSGR